jgi:hypothetical protein
MTTIKRVGKANRLPTSAGMTCGFAAVASDRGLLAQFGAIFI